MISKKKKFFLTPRGTPFPEYPGAAVTTTNITYASSINPTLTAIKATLVYPTDAVNLPVKLVIHGYHETAADVNNGSNANFTRWARLGYFVIGVEMRGSNGSSGSFDDGGREVVDCIDALNYVEANYLSKIALGYNSVLGFSHGGAIAYLLATRFPDRFNDVTVFYGISDHGVDPTYGWFQQEPTRQAGLQTAIGGTPGTVPDNYGARYSKSGIAVNYMGYLSIFHDDQDTAVDVSHSRRVVDEYVAASRTDYYYEESTVGSASRYLHQYPSDSNDIHDAEPLWKNNAKTKPVKTAPSACTMKVIGMLDTKLFTVNVNNGSYLNAVASSFGLLTYNMTANTFQYTNQAANPAVVCIRRKDNGHVIAGVLDAGETYTFSPVSILMDGDTPALILDPDSKMLLSGSDLTRIADLTGGPQYQGYSLVFTGARPAILPTDINSLPAVEHVAASTEGLVGVRRPDFQGINKFTYISVNTGTIVDHGASSTAQTQFDVLSGGNYFYAVNNGGTGLGQDAGTATYLVRSDLFDGTQATNALKLIRRENKVQQTVTFTGTIPSTTESNTSSVLGIGKRSYSASYFNGKWAKIIIFTYLVSNIGNKEDILKTRYAI